MFTFSTNSNNSFLAESEQVRPTVRLAHIRARPVVGEKPATWSVSTKLIQQLPISTHLVPKTTHLRP